jgi:hypothetical protein
VGDSEGAGPVCCEVGGLSKESGRENCNLVPHCEWEWAGLRRGVIGVVLFDDLG